MKNAHLIKVSIFSHEKDNEDSSLILDKFLDLFPFNIKDEKIKLNETKAEGFKENKITIFEVILTKERHIHKFLESLRGKIDEIQRELY